MEHLSSYDGLALYLMTKHLDLYTLPRHESSASAAL